MRSNRLSFEVVTTMVAVVLGGLGSPSFADDNTTTGEKLVGSGNAATEAREVEEFTEISVSTAIKLDVTVGPAIAIAVTADDNILPHVKTEVVSGRLKLYVDTSCSSKLGVKIQLATPALRGLRGSGAAKITVADASGERFRLGLSGASQCRWKGGVDALVLKIDGGSQATVSGSAGRLDMNCSGASKVNAQELTAKTAKVVISGASTARVNASEDLDVNASGASTLKYAGQPKVEQNVSGASRVSGE